MTVDPAIVTRLSEPSAAEAPCFRLWRQGARRDVSRLAFWEAVAGHRELAAESGSGNSGIDLLVGHTSLDLMAMFVALISAGRIPAFFPPHAPPQDRRAYFEQQRRSIAAVECRAIFAEDDEVCATIAAIDASLAPKTRCIESEARGSRDAAFRAAHAFATRLDSDAVLFVQHSSGTTGIKKGVGITGRALTAQFAAYWPLVRATLADASPAIASWLPLYHDMGLLTSFLMPLIAGDPVSLVDPFEWVKRPTSLYETIAADACSIAWMPNFAFRHLVRCKPFLRRAPLHTMRAWINCSEPCRLNDSSAFEESFADWGVRPGSVIGCYGMAEAVFAVTQGTTGARLGFVPPSDLRPGADLRDAGGRLLEDGERDAKTIQSSGRAIPGSEIRIVAGGQVLPELHYGEIHVRGPSIFAGYRGLGPQASGLSENGWFATGDLGTMAEDEVFVFGRLKDVIIVNGKNLHAGDIEEVVQSVEGIKPGRVVAFGLFNEAVGTEQLVIIAEAAEARFACCAATLNAVSARVAAALLVTPLDVRIVEERWLVKTTSGKISREANLQKYLESLVQTAPSKRSLSATHS